MHNRYLITLITLLISLYSDALSTCHSCIETCENLHHCDCSNSDDSDKCLGEYCYVKIDRLTADGLGMIRKGCADQAPLEYLDKCQYVSTNTSAECYCATADCNNAGNLRNYAIDPLPLMECCECDGLDAENFTIDCIPNGCIRNCTGNYCFNDINKQSQGCGWGYSMAWQFLRSPPRFNRSNDQIRILKSQDLGDLTCTSAYSDYKTLVRGCTCTSDFCNIADTVVPYHHNETENRETQFQYCYSLHAFSHQPFKADVYQQSSTCNGHFCFLTMTTNSIQDEADQNRTIWDNLSVSNKTRANWAQLKSRYEITAGCLYIDENEKVEIGCTTEWTSSEKEFTKKHCICRSHICNYFNLITGDGKKTLVAFDWKTSHDYGISISAATRWPACFWMIPVFIFHTINI